MLATGTALAAPLAADAQTPPGVLVVGQVAEPQALDPRASGTSEVEPAQATAWDISDDGTVYTFALREGVSFHDGPPTSWRSCSTLNAC